MKGLIKRWDFDGKMYIINAEKSYYESLLLRKNFDHGSAIAVRRKNPRKFEL